MPETAAPSSAPPSSAPPTTTTVEPGQITSPAPTSSRSSDAQPAETPSELSALDRFDADLKQIERPEPKKETAKQPDQKPVQEQSKQPDQKQDAKPSGFDPEKETNIKRLREWGRNLEKDLSTLRKESEPLKTKIAELEQRVPKSQEDAQALASKIDNLQKRLDEKEQAIRMKDYERSDEYKTKYQEPYINSVKDAYQEIKELIVEEPTGENDEDGRPVMRERPATEEDFNEVYRLGLGQAVRLAKQKFGDAASIVLGHRLAIRKADQARASAISDYQSKGTEREKQQEAQQNAIRSRYESHWQKANELLSADSRHAAYWGRDANDEESNKALESGFAFADNARSPEFRSKQTPEDLILLDAVVRHRVAGFSKLAYANSALRNENAALKDEVAKLRGSAPDAPALAPETPPSDESSPLEKFGKLSM